MSLHPTAAAPGFYRASGLVRWPTRDHRPSGLAALSLPFASYGTRPKAEVGSQSRGPLCPELTGRRIRGSVRSENQRLHPPPFRRLRARSGRLLPLRDIQESEAMETAGPRPGQPHPAVRGQFVRQPGRHRPLGRVGRCDMGATVELRRRASPARPDFDCNCVVSIPCSGATQPGPCRMNRCGSDRPAETPCR